MATPDDQISISYNGEIYNFPELRIHVEELGYQLRSRSDTEVILYLYQHYGPEFLSQLNGMFALGIWDRQSGQLLLARDRLGEKPLYFYQGAGLFVWASELRSLMRHPGLPRCLNQTAIRQFLTFGYIPGDTCIYQGVEKLKPGHYVIYDGHSTQIKRYWTLSTAVDSNVDEAGAADQVRRLLTDSVRMRMISDVPLGGFLSGGLDSSLVVGLMASMSSTPVQAFTVAFPREPHFDESPQAEQVARFYGAEHYRIELTSDMMLEGYREVIASFDEPFGDSSAIPSYFLARETRRSVTVALSGDGSDEIFAGYRKYSWPHLHERLGPWSKLLRPVSELVLKALPEGRRNRWLNRVRMAKKVLRLAHLNGADAHYGYMEIADAAMTGRLFPTSAGQDVGLQLIRSLWEGGGDDIINHMLATDLAIVLPDDMLTKVDRTTMAHALEVRAPFLDHRLVEYAFSLPGHFKHNGRVGKRILRAAFRDFLPPVALQKAKQGFEVPIDGWLRTELAPLRREYFDPARVRQQGLFDPSAFERYVELDSSKDNSWRVWNMLVFQVWLEAQQQALVSSR